MAKKLRKTDLQVAYETYATDVLRSQTTQLYTVPTLGICALDPDYNSDHVEIMTHLVFADETIIEQAKETYRLVLENDIEERFLPNQRSELLGMINRLVKNYGIALKSMLTAAKRDQQICKTFDIKLYPKRKSLEELSRKRLEAKWFYNDILDKGEKGYDASVTTVEVFNPQEDKRYPRQLRCLTSRERQGILKQVRSSIKGLSSSKEKGRKVGHLKFKSRIDTIPLEQYGITHVIRDDLKHVHIAGVTRDIYARGLEQLAGWEISVAKLMWLADGIHLKVTAYKDKEKINETAHTYRTRGTVATFDLGVSNQMTFADGTIVNILFENSATWRAADKKTAAQQKGSQSREKTKAHRRKAALRDTYKKDDAANKVCALISKNEICITQGDRIEGWRRADSIAHGSKKIQHGILGRVMSRLKERGGVYMLDQWTPTTQVCPKCHAKTKHSLDEPGNIICASCHFEYPRNAGAAWSMEYAALEEFGTALPKWFEPIKIEGDVAEALSLARKRSAWTANMTHDISDPKTLDAILGHVDDKSHVGEDMSGRKRPKEKNGWVSKRKTRGKEDKWAKHSKNYKTYVRVEAAPVHSDEPVVKVSSNDTDEGRRRHNKSRSRSRADRRAYRWARFKRERHAREHERCAKRDEKRLAKQTDNNKVKENNNQCTPGTGGINAGGDGRKSLNEVCRCVASSKKPEATTSGAA